MDKEQIEEIENDVDKNIEFYKKEIETKDNIIKELKETSVLEVIKDIIKSLVLISFIVLLITMLIFGIFPKNQNRYYAPSSPCIPYDIMSISQYK